jgi:hypothetical protein
VPVYIWLWAFVAGCCSWVGLGLWGVPLSQHMVAPTAAGCSLPDPKGDAECRSLEDCKLVMWP